MFLLNDKKIVKYLKQGNIEIENFDKKYLLPTCYTFRLGLLCHVWNEQKNSYEIELLGENTGKYVLKIPPRGYAKIESFERFKLKENVWAIFGQSSKIPLNGLRLNHGPTIDPNFNGILEMGLENLLPKVQEIELGETLAKVMFYDISDTYPISSIKGTPSEQDYIRRANR